MPSLIRKLFRKSEAPNDDFTQPQREAIVDLLNYCMYADDRVFLAEDRLIADTVAKFNWDPKIPFDQFDVRSIDNARNATENQGYRDQFLASIRDRLGTAAVKGQALDLCQELFVADGSRSDEEDDVFQNPRRLLEEIPGSAPVSGAGDGVLAITNFSPRSFTTEITETTEEQEN